MSTLPGSQLLVVLWTEKGETPASCSLHQDLSLVMKPMSDPTAAAVVVYAIRSRILVLTLIIMWRSLVSPYDTSASINPSCLSHSPDSPAPSVVFPKWVQLLKDRWYGIQSTLSGLLNVAMSTSRLTPSSPSCLFSSPSSLCSSAPHPADWLYSCACSVWLSCPHYVYNVCYPTRLSVIILKDRDASLRASLRFCFNPASIFYSSIYTESLYALFSIGSIYYLMSGTPKTSVVLLALSGFARSNGVLNAGYFGFKTLHQSYHAIFSKNRVLLASKVILAGAFRCVCIFSPFLAFQAYGYYNLCHGRKPDEMRPWCRTRIPLLYSFIQSHYWGVGFLRYFQLKQIPNFLLALPVLSLAFCSIISYLKTELENFFSLSFRVALPARCDDHYATKQEAACLKSWRLNVNTQATSVSRAESEVSVKQGYYTVVMLPFIYHLSFMAATALLVMHVQVSTRFLSASPPLYWYASYLMASMGKSRRWAYWIWAYSASYILLGTLLFSTFYPFT